MQAILWAADPAEPVPGGTAPLELMPVYDRPAVYYALSTAVLAGAGQIVVATRPGERDAFDAVLGDGTRWGLRIDYVAAEAGGGPGELLRAATDRLAHAAVLVVRAGTVLHGGAVERRIAAAASARGAVIFLPWTARLNRPATATGPRAGAGLYHYDAAVAKRLADLPGNARDPDPFAAVNAAYHRRGELRVRVLERGTAWLDARGVAGVASAAEYVRVVRERLQIEVGCVAEAAWWAGFLDDAGLRALAGRPGVGGCADLRELLDRTERRARCPR